jgi:hypothetical protein
VTRRQPRRERWFRGGSAGSAAGALVRRSLGRVSGGRSREILTAHARQLDADLFTAGLIEMGYPFQSGTGGDIASVTPHEGAALDATPCEAAHATVWRGSGSRAELPTTLAIPRYVAGRRVT